MRRPIMREIRQFDEDHLERRDGFVLAGWGIATILCVITAVASWRFVGAGRLPLFDIAELWTDRTTITGSITKPSTMPDQAPVGAVVQTRTPDLKFETDIDLLRKEIITLRRKTDKLQEQYDTLTRRIATSEASLNDVTGSINPMGEVDRPLKKSRIGDNPVVHVEKLPFDPSRFDDRTNTFETGKPAAADPPVMTTAPKTRFALDLGQHANEGDATAVYMRLRARHPEIFDGLDPLIRVGEKDGKPAVRLVVGPYENAAEAATICAAIMIAGDACKPTIHTGRILVMR